MVGMYDFLYSGYPFVVMVYRVSFGSSELRWFFIKGCSSGYQSQRLVVQLHGPPIAGVLAGAALPELLSQRFSCAWLVRTAPPSTVCWLSSATVSSILPMWGGTHSTPSASQSSLSSAWVSA